MPEETPAKRRERMFKELHRAEGRGEKQRQDGQQAADDETPKRPTEPWELPSALEELRNYAETASPMIIPQWLPPSGLVVLTAAGRWGKSTIALELAWQLADKGSDWLGLEIPRPRYRRVLYLSREMSKRQATNAMLAQARKHEAVQLPAHLRYLVAQSDDGEPLPRLGNELTELVRGGEAAAVVLDSLTAFAPSSHDAISEGDMESALSLARTLAELVIVIAHPSQPGRDQIAAAIRSGSLGELDPAHAIRGNSRAADHADVVLAGGFLGARRLLGVMKQREDVQPSELVEITLEGGAVAAVERVQPTAPGATLRAEHRVLLDALRAAGGSLTWREAEAVDGGPEASTLRGWKSRSLPRALAEAGVEKASDGLRYMLCLECREPDDGEHADGCLSASAPGGG